MTRIQAKRIGFFVLTGLTFAYRISLAFGVLIVLGCSSWYPRMRNFVLPILTLLATVCDFTSAGRLGLLTPGLCTFLKGNNLAESVYSFAATASPYLVVVCGLPNNAHDFDDDALSVCFPKHYASKCHVSLC